MPSYCNPCAGGCKKRQASETRGPDTKKVNSAENAGSSTDVPRLSKDLLKELNVLSPKIVIVGAGAAGMAAVQRLLEAGFNNVMVLEAQSYVGGRICSQSLENGYLEKGAQFLHGENCLTSAVKEKGLALAVNTDEPPKLEVHVAAKEHGPEGVFLLDDDSQLSELPKDVISEALKETYKTINSIVDRCKQTAPEIAERVQDVGESRRTTLGHFLRTEFEQFMGTKDDEATCVKAYRWAIFEWMMRVHLSDCASRTLYDLSVMEYSKYAGSLECTPLKVPMIDALKLCVSRALSEQAPILLNKPVKQLRFDPSQPNPLVIFCEDGQAFVADHCIVTCSLGFLKKNQATFFLPPLPAEKARAIEAAGFGTVNKIFLTFAEAWWNGRFEKTGGFQLLYMNEPKGSQQKPWYRQIVGFDVCNTNPNTLVAWIGGSEQAEAMEAMSDSDVAADCQALLQRFLKNVIVPPPIQVIRTAWASNPYILGAYSYSAVNQSEHMSVLQQPMWLYKKLSAMTPADTNNPRRSMDGQQLPALFFAGEALDPTWFSTVPGALESGRREAERLIALYKPLVNAVAGSADATAKQSLITAPFEQRTSVQSQQERRTLTQQNTESNAYVSSERKTLTAVPTEGAPKGSLSQAAPPRNSAPQTGTLPDQSSQRFSR
ncbi:peroxisomal N(1)-acetyl-spermine/spermidine oxidase-like [Paramacrobiotus metropolitanus]|uniref:peroxisomal N(1)-acetyl-spermine/spermidine oxidase-like n=1 Tax=Paramacrobiotus metropolitanus TaxID=2943436 RepID=UPI00244604A0|nr:peroxisomal N(1)-acetyl-spermine/spermidine oxidase-like [Paramacrobiotus metropolitanus]